LERQNAVKWNAAELKIYVSKINYILYLWLIHFCPACVKHVIKVEMIHDQPLQSLNFPRNDNQQMICVLIEDRKCGDPASSYLFFPHVIHSYIHPTYEKTKVLSPPKKPMYKFTELYCIIIMMKKLS